MLMVLTSPHLNSAVGVAKVAGATESASSFFSSCPKETATSDRTTAKKNKTFIFEQVRIKKTSLFEHEIGPEMC